jgi:hypothetical protein
MKKSTHQLETVLQSLARRARERGLTDSAWAARADIRKETLSRLRGRPSCDFSTLQSLAEAVGVSIGVIEGQRTGLAADDGFPDRLDREYEDQLLELCASGDLGLPRWRRLGPPFFMAGLAVMLASSPNCDRRSLLDLAESLLAGSTQVEVFGSWLERSPVRPSRFLPMLDARIRHAA